MRVIPVPCRSDNYECVSSPQLFVRRSLTACVRQREHRYIIACEQTGETAVVDPYDPKKLDAAASENGLGGKLATYLLTTHHHHDHSGGNEEFIKAHSAALKGVYGGSKQSPGVDHVLKHGDTFKIGALDVRALHTPCHTQDHICYFVEDKQKGERAVFTGDTLFVSGCGRFFEGEPAEMHAALNEKLAALPDDTVTYVGHEYTSSVIPIYRALTSLPSQCAKAKRGM